MSKLQQQRERAMLAPWENQSASLHRYKRIGCYFLLLVTVTLPHSCTELQIDSSEL